MGQTLSLEKQSDTLNELTQYLMDNYRERLVDSNFCDKLELFVSNEMQNKAPKLQDEGKRVLIGTRIQDPLEKAKICSEYTQLYVKKLNLVASIHLIVKYSLKKIAILEKGPRCVPKEGPDMVRKYTPSNDIPYRTNIDTSILINKDKYKNSNPIQLDDKYIRERAYLDFQQILKKEKKVNYLTTNIVKNLLMAELDESQCKDNAEMITSTDDLIKYNFIPDQMSPELKKYNKIYTKYINILKQNVAKKTSQLLSIASSIIKSKLVNKTIVYIENHNITLDQLNNFIEKAKGIIIQILIELNKYSLLLINFKYTTMKDINQYEALNDTINNYKQSSMEKKKAFEASNR